jgi:hypothetical protein
MVRWLIEYEQISRTDEQRGKGDAPAFTAGHRPDRRVESHAGHTESTEDSTDARVTGPLVLGCERRR